MQVLKMIESGQVTAAEAIELLDILGRTAETSRAVEMPPPASLPNRMRIRITDLRTGQQKVDFALPWDLATVGMEMGAKFTPRDVDLDLEDVQRAVEAGAEGKVLEVVDEAEGERVEIFVE